MSSEQDEKNTINDKNKIIDENNNNYSYKKDLWMYFESINSKFYKDRQKAKVLMYIISLKNNLVEEYANNLDSIYNQFYIELSYFSDNNSVNHNLNNDKKYSLDNIMNLFLESIKIESQLCKDYIKLTKEKFFNNLEENLKIQYDKNSNLNELIKTYEKKFKKVIEKVNEIKLDYEKAGILVEKSKKELEIVNEEIELQNEQGIIEINNVRQKKCEDENNERIKEAKEKQKKYEDYIIEANKEREKYIELSEQIYDLAQKLDNDYYELIKDKMSSYINSKNEVLNKVIENNINIIKNIKSCDFNFELEQFANSKFPKFSPPKPFTYEQYNPYLVLRERNDNDVKPQVYKIIATEIYHLFLPENIELNHINNTCKENDKINIEDFDYTRDVVHQIWSCNKFDSKKLNNLLKKADLRLVFLRELNQYRVEGIFILEKKSYDDLVSVFNVILNNSRKEKDFESINLCMILSQTFYKISKDNIFLQTEVKKNEIWKKHSFWEEIIEFSIKEKIYNTKGFLIFLEENEEEREERVKQAVNSILITFLYNMQLFDMSKEERKKIINKFVNKYDIKNFMFLDNELEVDEINDEVIIESVASNLDIQPEE
jgi:hypothetical protein